MISIHLCFRSYGKNVYYSLSIALVLFCEYAFSFLFSGFQSVPVIINPTERTHRHLPYLYCRKVCRPPLATISTKMAPISCEQKMFYREKNARKCAFLVVPLVLYTGQKPFFPHLFAHLQFLAVDSKWYHLLANGETRKPRCLVRTSILNNQSPQQRLFIYPPQATPTLRRITVLLYTKPEG